LAELEARLGQLLQVALEQLEMLDVDAQFETIEVATGATEAIRLELGGAEALVMTDGIEYLGNIYTSVLMVVATGDAVQLSPRRRLEENATSALGWYADASGGHGLRDGIPGDPLEPGNLHARVREAIALLGPRPRTPPAFVPAAQLEPTAAILRGRGVAVTALADGLAFETPAAPAELRVLERDGRSATVVWLEVSAGDRSDLAEWLLRRGAAGFREGTLALAPDGRVLVRGWAAGEELGAERLTRLLAPLLTSAQELRAELPGELPDGP
jgi:hypothetical protein